MKKQTGENSKVQSFIGCLASIMRGLYSFIKGVFIFFCIVFILASFVKYFGWFSSEVTAYPIKCKEKPIGNYCKDPEYTFTPTHHKVDVKNQIVLYWIEGFPIKKLTKCAIKDKHHWSCKYDDESAEFGFNNGKYFSITLKTELDYDSLFNECYVSRYKYLETACQDEKSELRKYGCMALMNLLE